jgi:hypothetical protein
MSEVVEASPATALPASDGETAAISLREGFRFDQVDARDLSGELQVAAQAPALGPLAEFVGTWRGRGFNTIFRPQSPQTPTPLPHPGVGPNDNVLELNLTHESLAFSPSLGSVPNRGMKEADAFLNRVPYLQTISDITEPAKPVEARLRLRGLQARSIGGAWGRPSWTDLMHFRGSRVAFPWAGAGNRVGRRRGYRTQGPPFGEGPAAVVTQRLPDPAVIEVRHGPPV